MTRPARTALLALTILGSILTTTNPTSVSQSEGQGTTTAMAVADDNHLTFLSTVSGPLLHQRNAHDVNDSEKDFEGPVIGAGTIPDSQVLQQFALRSFDKREGKMVRNTSFYGAECGIDEHCFDILTLGLECRDEVCKCRFFKGLELKWREDRGVCLSAKGHPCATNTMCFSDQCDKKRHICNEGVSRFPRFTTSKKLTSILMDLSFHFSLPVYLRVIALRLF